MLEMKTPIYAEGGTLLFEWIGLIRAYPLVLNVICMPPPYWLKLACQPSTWMEILTQCKHFV